MTNFQRLANEGFLFVTEQEGIEIWVKAIHLQNTVKFIQVVKYIKDGDYVVSWNDMIPVETFFLYKDILKLLSEQGEL